MNTCFADRVKGFTSSAIREMAGVIQKGNNVISFAGGFPYEEYFPSEQLVQAFNVVLSDKKALQYGMTQGYLPLREMLAERMKAKEIHCSPENIVITTGSQQAMDLFTRIIISPGDVILTENPTFLAALQSFQSYEAKIVPVESDRDGMHPQDLEEKIKKFNPKFIYVVPNFSNPEGKVWSDERRRSLLEIANRYNVLIFEDDPYGDIKFNKNDKFTSIAAMDTEQSTVIYASSFSKTLVPSLRIGWATGPSHIMKVLSQIKEPADLTSATINQQAVYQLLQSFDLNAHIEMLSRKYYEHMITMQDYLKTLDPSSFSWEEPKGGFFIWLKTHESINTTELLKEAVDNGVAFIPGSPFYVENPQHNTIRLNFTNSSPENIKIGMDRLATVFNKRSAQGIGR